MATAANDGVVVWEWCDDQGLWHLYPSKVSNYIEYSYKLLTKNNFTATAAPTALVHAEPSMGNYEVDLNQMLQTRKDTGRQRAIRRDILGLDSLTAEGVTWNWSGDFGNWEPYSPQAAALIEEAHVKRKNTLDLGSIGLPYVVDFKKMTQTKKGTGFERKVRRDIMTVPYVTQNGLVVPPISKSSSSIATGTAKIRANVTRMFSFGSTSQHAQGTSAHQHSLKKSPRSSIGGFFSSILPSTSSARRGGSPTQLPVPKRVKSQEQMDTSPQSVIEKFTSPVEKPDKEECPICCEEMTSASGYDSADTTVVLLSKCKHHYHRACLLSMYATGPKDGSLQCPTCKCIHGVKNGNCPPGKISVESSAAKVPGFDNCGAIIITYDIKGGIQGPEHQNPGQAFSARGFPRRGYLPDNEQGRKISRLLQEAWRRKLTFTIGNSVTTGEPDTVVWNEIHHKTEIENSLGHGYPDPNYLDNVLKELETQGVTEELMEVESEGTRM